MITPRAKFFLLGLAVFICQSSLADPDEDLALEMHQANEMADMVLRRVENGSLDPDWLARVVAKQTAPFLNLRYLAQLKSDTRVSLVMTTSVEKSPRKSGRGGIYLNGKASMWEHLDEFSFSYNGEPIEFEIPDPIPSRNSFSIRFQQGPAPFDLVDIGHGEFQFSTLQMREDISQSAWLAFVKRLASLYRPKENAAKERLLETLSKKLNMSPDELIRRVTDTNQVSTIPTMSELTRLGINQDHEDYFEQIKLLQTLIRITETVDSVLFLTHLLRDCEGCSCALSKPKLPYTLVGLDLGPNPIIKRLLEM